MPLPDFTKMREGVDPKLNEILHKTLARPREQRYQTAAELLTALEVYLYSDGYGPTNEKLADYVRDLYGPHGATASQRWMHKKSK